MLGTDKSIEVNNQSKGKRIIWLDFAKLIAIYLVVFGHALQYLHPGTDPHYNYMWLFVYSFHMPLFMLISGYFSYSILNESFLTLIKKKTFQLIIPCLLWGIIWYLLKVSYTYKGMDDIVNNIIPNIKWLTMDVLWFLKSLFLCIFLCYIFRKNIWLLILSLLLSQIMPFKLPSMYPCFLVGLLCRHKDIFTKINFKWTAVVVVLFIILFIFFEPCHMQTNLRATAKGMITGEYKLFLIELWNRFYCLLIGVIGSLSVISLCKSLFQVVKHSSFLERSSEYGAQTQAVYILHGPIMVYGIAYFISFNSMKDCIYNLVVCPVIALILLIICLLFINLCSPKVRNMLFGSKN